MRTLLLSAALAMSFVFPEVRAAPGSADLGAPSVLFVLPGRNQQTGSLAEPAMEPVGAGHRWTASRPMHVPARAGQPVGLRHDAAQVERALFRIPPRAPWASAHGASTLLGVVTRDFPANAQEVMVIATAATETDPKAVAKEHAGRARVEAADRSGSTLTSLDFGDVLVGQSRSLALTVHNLGTGNLEVTNITSITRDNAVFSVVLPVCPPDCFIVAPGGQHSVTVKFRPETAGSQEGELHIASNDLDPEPVRITLRGVGVAPNIRVDRDPLDFGPVALQQSHDKELTVVNDGTSVLAVTSITRDNEVFSVVLPAVPFMVLPNGKQAVTMRFSPRIAGEHNGILTISSDDPDERTVSIQLHGVGGVPDIGVDPTPLDFGVVLVLRDATKNMAVANTGNVPLTVTSITRNNEAFSVVLPAVPFTVPPNDEQAVTMRFSSRITGGHNGILTISSDDPDERTVSIQLRGSVTCPEGTEFCNPPARCPCGEGTAGCCPPFRCAIQGCP